MELNGETEIDAKVFPAPDAESALKMEYSENEQREPFTYSEKMEYAKLIEEIESAKALERKSIGGKGGILEDVDHGPHLEQGKSRDAVGKKIGMSGKQYDRAKYVAENAPQEIIDELDRGERSIKGTYDELRAKEKSENTSVSNTQPQTAPVQENNEPEQKSREFSELSPEEKIEELQKQVKEQRFLYNSAKSDFAREKTARQNETYHYNITLEMMEKRLETAYKRITELEEKYEPGQHTPWVMPENIRIL
jgi:ParB family chromosome partitioning protein